MRKYNRMIKVMEINKGCGALWNPYKSVELTAKEKPLCLERVILAILDMQEDNIEPELIIMNDRTLYFLSRSAEMNNQNGVVVNNFGVDTTIMGIKVFESKICNSGEVYFY